MRRRRWTWTLLLALTLLWCGSPSVAEECADQVKVTVTHGMGNTLVVRVENLDEYVGWDDYVLMSVIVDGEHHLYSYRVTLEPDGNITHILLFSDPPTLFGVWVCEDPDGTTESPEPIGIMEKKG